MTAGIPAHDDVTVDAIVKVLLANADRARTLVKSAAPRVAADTAAGACSCRFALEHALLTAPAARDPQMMQQLAVVAGRVLGTRSAP